MSEVVLEDVVKAYGDVVAVDHVSFTINDGEFIALVGPSGCGKTTTLNMVAGLTELTSGTITIGGTTIPIAAGTTLGNQNLITLGANLCLSGTLNASGQLVPPSSVSANANTSVNVCGTVTSFTAASTNSNGSITIGGTTIPIAAGTTLGNQNLITLGANLCLTGTLNAFGQLILPSSVNAGAAAAYPRLSGERCD